MTIVDWPLLVLCFRYLYGEPVQGTAYVVFGVKINQEMRRLPSVKQVLDVSHCSILKFIGCCLWFIGAVMTFFLPQLWATHIIISCCYYKFWFSLALSLFAFLLNLLPCLVLSKHYCGVFALRFCFAQSSPVNSEWVQHRVIWLNNFETNVCESSFLNFEIVVWQKEEILPQGPPKKLSLELLTTSHSFPQGREFAQYKCVSISCLSRLWGCC